MSMNQCLCRHAVFRQSVYKDFVHCVQHVADHENLLVIDDAYIQAVSPEIKIYMFHICTLFGQYLTEHTL